MAARALLLGLCALQLISTLERQVFDFLGFMWAPILANFLNILFIIFGSFGTFQYVAKYIYSYATWNILWLAWNTFVICYYLNVGILDRDNGLLALGTGSVSWWEVNGWGCRARYGDIDGSSWLAKPKEVEGCLMHFAHVEVAHAALQCLLGFLSVVLGFYHASNLVKSDENHIRGSMKSAGNQSLYSIEFTRPAELRAEPAAKPMTPRRVKRRSVSSRHSTRRSSRRSSQRRSSSHHSNGGHSNPNYRQSSQHSLNDSYNDEDLYNNRPASVRSSYSNFHGARPISLHTDTGIYPESNYHNDNYMPHRAPSPGVADSCMYPTPSPNLSTEATPQVPQKRNVPVVASSSSSVPYRIYGNQNTFLNNGPPAYHLHQSSHLPMPPDNETVM